MSISKEMNPTSTTNTQKSRGRPKTAFVSQKPKTKQDGPGRPRKTIETKTTIESPIIEKPIIVDENKKKDTFILVMFLFSLCIFSASLYFSGKKQSMEESEQTIQQVQEATIDEESVIEDIPAIEQTGGQEDSIQTTGSETPADTSNNIVSNFYDALNTNTLSEIYPSIDSRLRATKLFKVYFSKTRIQRFLNNLTEAGVQMSEFNETGSTISYKLTYTLKDGKSFEEIREIGLITKETPQIGKMRCINTGCSTLPFFNPGKYNLK